MSKILNRKTFLRSLIAFGALWTALGLNSAEQETTKAKTSPIDLPPLIAKFDFENQAPSPAKEISKFSNWQNCFKDSVISNSEFAQTEILKSISSNSDESAEEVIENLHIKTAQGQEMRLHLRINDQSGRREALLFDLDSEGYPMLLSFPDDVQNFSVEEKKEWFVRQGNLDFSEKTLSASMNGAHARWLETNGRVKNLEVSFSDRSLSCGETLDSCICRL